MPFYNNNNRFSNLPCCDWMQKPLQISEGGSPKGSWSPRDWKVLVCKFIGTKESFEWQKCSSPTGMVWHTKIAIVSLFWDTKCAFDWEIWIYILKSGFRICNQTRNPKTDLNAEISVFGFPFYRSIGKWKTVLKNSGFLHAHASKRRPPLTRIVLQILFRISQSNGKKEIHEIRIWIS